MKTYHSFNEPLGMWFNLSDKSEKNDLKQERKKGRKNVLFFLLAHHFEDECASHCVSLPLFGKRIFLCARCTGLILGLFFLHVPFLLFPSLILPKFLKFSLFLISGLLMAVDWFLYKLEFIPSTSTRRFLTGISGGVSLSLLARIKSPFLLALGFGIVFTTLGLVMYVKLIKEG